MNDGQDNCRWSRIKSKYGPLHSGQRVPRKCIDKDKLSSIGGIHAARRLIHVVRIVSTFRKL